MKYFSIYLGGDILVGGVFLSSFDFFVRVIGFLAIIFLGFFIFFLGFIILVVFGVSLFFEGVRVFFSKLMLLLFIFNIIYIRNKYDIFVVILGKRKMKLREIIRYIVS